MGHQSMSSFVENVLGSISLDDLRLLPNETGINIEKISININPNVKDLFLKIQPP
jgi:hypothetical protein